MNDLEYIIKRLKYIMYKLINYNRDDPMYHYGIELQVLGKQIVQYYESQQKSNNYIEEFKI